MLNVTIYPNMLIFVMLFVVRLSDITLSAVNPVWRMVTDFFSFKKYFVYYLVLKWLQM
jgi:hypothetical protein